MRKSIKTTFISIFVFMFLSIATCLGGLSFFVKDTADAATTNVYEIKDAEDLFNIIDNLGPDGAKTNYVLGANIDMSDPKHTLHSTFGTETNPFSGTFDGRGYKISNLTFDLSTDRAGQEVEKDTKYVGLFGLTDKATISNVQITGTTTYKIGKCTNAYVGALVGSATNNTTINYVQNISTPRFVQSGASGDVVQKSFSHSIIYGGLVGSASSSKIAHVINRQRDQVSFEFSDRSPRISSIGGVVGTLNSSSLIYGSSATNQNITIGETFGGTVNAGGVFGTVSGYGVVDGQSVSVVNVIAENTINLTNNKSSSASGKVYVGQVGGSILSPFPASLGLSSIYFRKNRSSITAYGETNGYVYSNSTTREIETQFTSKSDFDSYEWCWNWDFDEVWYFNGGALSLQSFYGGEGKYTVKLSSSSINSNVITIENTLADRYSYGSSAEIKFSFKTAEDGRSLAEYYTITGLDYNIYEENKVAFDYQNGVYTVATDPDKYSITEESVSGRKVYTIKIERVNVSTAGEYNIHVRANPFNVHVTSKLFDASDAIQEIPDPPGYVNIAGNSTREKELDVSLNYNGSRSIETRLRNNNLPYAFVGWYLEKDGGQDTLLSNSSTYEIKFGFGEFTTNRNIYAKYVNDACIIRFDIKGDGIAEILVNGNPVNDKVAQVSKRTSSVVLAISIKEGFDFDVDRFLDMMRTYNGQEEDVETETPFCTWTNKEDGSENEYIFSLDMSVIRDGLTQEGFTIIIDTEKDGGTKNNLVWYIVGGVGGAIVLGVVIFLIVFFVKRKGGSGGGKRGGFGGRKSFKGGYY